MRYIIAALLLAPALPAVADTRCTRSFNGDWNCTDRLGGALYQIQESSTPGKWRVNPAVGSKAKPCEIRTTFNGDAVSHCW